jgi:hypothetical protein
MGFHAELILESLIQIAIHTTPQQLPNSTVISLHSDDKLGGTPTLVGRFRLPVFAKYLRIESSPLITDECLLLFVV